MTGRAPKNLVASVRDRLRTLARQQREDYNFTLMRYANKRFLYRRNCTPTPAGRESRGVSRGSVNLLGSWTARGWIG